MESASSSSRSKSSENAYERADDKSIGAGCVNTFLPDLEMLCCQSLRRRHRAEDGTHFLITSARRPNWNRLRTTKSTVSKTSSPLALHPEKKTTTTVMMHKTVIARSSVL